MNRAVKIAIGLGVALVAGMIWIALRADRREAKAYDFESSRARSNQIPHGPLAGFVTSDADKSSDETVMGEAPPQAGATAQPEPSKQRQRDAMERQVFESGLDSRRLKPDIDDSKLKIEVAPLSEPSRRLP